MVFARELHLAATCCEVLLASSYAMCTGRLQPVLSHPVSDRGDT